MAKARKRRRLLRVAIASGLLVVAVPSVATGHDHLTPVDALDRGRQAGVDCSMDPRDPRLMKPGARMCDQVIANEVPTGQERALVQHLVPEVGARIDQAPAPSDRTEIESWWGIVGLVVAAGGAAGLIFGLRRGRPHALS